jgi:DNA-binding NarL/FixJ family response regulator
MKERLSTEHDLEIVDATADSVQAVQRAILTKPDVLLIDPVTKNGVDFKMIRSFRECSPLSSIVVLTAFVDTALQVELRKLGVCKILEKGIVTDQLINILRETYTNSSNPLEK